MIDPANEQAMDGTRIVAIATAPNEVIADLWRQVLDEDGIIAVLKPTGAGSSFGTNALNEHLVFVREDQAELAREIIAELESEVDEEN